MTIVNAPWTVIFADFVAHLRKLIKFVFNDDAPPDEESPCIISL